MDFDLEEFYYGGNLRWMMFSPWGGADYSSNGNGIGTKDKVEANQAEPKLIDNIAEAVQSAEPISPRPKNERYAFIKEKYV